LAKEHGLEYNRSKCTNINNWRLVTSVASEVYHWTKALLKARSNNPKEHIPNKNIVASAAGAD
jgi:hypothetical protein